MILDSGWDLFLLSQPELWHGGRRTNKLVLIGADHNLGLLRFRCVTHEFHGSLAPHIPAILQATDLDFLRYAAIAHEADLADNPETDYRATKELERQAAERGVHLLSRLFITPDTWCSTGPMKTFSTYPLEQDVLPTMTITPPPRYPEPRLLVRTPARAPDGRSR